MNNIFLRPTQRTVRAGLAVLAAVLLLSGAAWHGFAAEPQMTAAATVTTPIAHAVAGARESYADIVDVVAPAVVTVRAQGRQRVAPTQFQMPADEFFGQLLEMPADTFCGQFFAMPNQGRRGQGPRQMQRPRQSALGSGVVVTTDGYILTN